MFETIIRLVLNLRSKFVNGRIQKFISNIPYASFKFNVFLPGEYAQSKNYFKTRSISKPIFWQAVTDNDIDTFITTLPSNKSSGSYDVSAFFVKIVSSLITPVLVFICNECLFQG